MQTQKWQIHGTMWWRFQKWPSFYKRRSLRAYKSSSLSFLEFLSYHRNNNDISTNPVIELWIYKSWTKCCQEQSTSIIIAMRHWFLEENGRCKWYSYIIPNHHNGKQLNKHIIYNSQLKCCSTIFWVIIIACYSYQGAHLFPFLATISSL